MRHAAAAKTPSAARPVSAGRADLVLFVAGVLLALGAGAVVFVLAPVLGMGRASHAPAPLPSPSRFRPAPARRWNAPRFRRAWWRRLARAAPPLPSPPRFRRAPASARCWSTPGLRGAWRRRLARAAAQPLGALGALAWEHPEVIWIPVTVVLSLAAALVLVVIL
jgi:hypothetical protein